MEFDFVAFRDYLYQSFKIESYRVGLSTTLVGDLGLDELDRIEILIFLEQSYGVKFPDESVNRYGNILELVMFVLFSHMGSDAPTFQVK